MVNVCLVQRGKEESKTCELIEIKKNSFVCAVLPTALFLSFRNIVMFASSPISLVLFIVIHSNSNSHSNLALLQQLLFLFSLISKLKCPDALFPEPSSS